MQQLCGSQGCIVWHAGVSHQRLSTGFWVGAVSKFFVQRFAKHLDRYQRFHPEDGQQVRMNPTAQRFIPEVSAVRTASLSSLSLVSITCANYAARLRLCIL